MKIWEHWPKKTCLSGRQVQAIVQPVKPVEQIPEGMQARIINRKMLTHDILELTLEVHEELKIIPGQRALLMLKDAQGYFPKSYSIVDFDVDEGTTLFVLGIKLVGGR